MIGIIGAMNEEINFFLSHMENTETTTHAHINYISGDISSKRVVLVKSGVGKVNASVCTQILIDRFQVKQIIFTGVAGALHPNLEVGDIAISTECIQHDIDVTSLGYRQGEIPFFPEYIFTADTELVKIAQDAAKIAAQGQVMLGRVLSGDQFVANPAIVAHLYKELDGICVEMEGAAVAQVCYMNQIPFVIIRSISDKADGSAHMSFTKFVEIAAENSFRIVKQMLDKI